MVSVKRSFLGGVLEFASSFVMNALFFIIPYDFYYKYKYNTRQSTRFIRVYLNVRIRAVDFLYGWIRIILVTVGVRGEMRVFTDWHVRLWRSRLRSLFVYVLFV